ncbi:hypothetical protein BD626DRAFT_544078 [Schizophyllum amplum]|uniref:Uncharacterized protein n=1 Tax=Schizophyllum amplum TaxID=97359 RepID=A0A550CWZ7_9AGAR|nr:hypothetical protein BD626DRAFT_544078 [Auriculariopsis ampla]
MGKEHKCTLHAGVIVESSSRSNSASEASSSTSKLAQPRTSILPAVLPHLRRSIDEPTTITKEALLTLQLSSHSFLDSLVHDEASDQAVYSIQTKGASTTITRSDHWDETTAADIRWPKTLPSGNGQEGSGVRVQMNGREWLPGDSLLKSGSRASGTQKFCIPGYSHCLKWRPQAGAFWCTTVSVKGPIAILEPASASTPPKIVVYETLRDKYDTRSRNEHGGVSILLLDYLVATALLLVTDVQEWMVVRKYEGPTLDVAPPEGLDGETMLPHSHATSNRQWRKIIFGEPLYRKRSLSLGSISSSTQSDTMPATPISDDPPHIPPEGDAFEFGAGEALSGSSEAATPEASGSPVLTRPSSLVLDLALPNEATSRPSVLSPPSPSAESICYPLANASAPAHMYLDPAFYGENNIPPVLSLPSDQTSISSLPRLERSISIPGRRAGVRELPTPPREPAPVLDPSVWTPSPISPSTDSSDLLTFVRGPSSASSIRPSTAPGLADVPSPHPRTHTNSMNVRRLPQLPMAFPADPDSEYPDVRHARNATQMDDGVMPVPREKRSSAPLQIRTLPLPPTPTATSTAVPHMPAPEPYKDEDVEWMRTSRYDAPPPYSAIFDS